LITGGFRLVNKKIHVYFPKNGQEFAKRGQHSGIMCELSLRGLRLSRKGGGIPGIFHTAVQGHTAENLDRLYPAAPH